jgi:hypothetical protein
MAFEVWAAPYAGGIEMGRFACFEAVLYATGLGLVLVSLSATAAPGAGGKTRRVAWLLWVVVALAAAVAVLRRLPP